MNVYAKRWLPALGTGLLLFSATPSFALVNIEFRPPSQTVNNGATVGIEIYAVSDDATDQAVGLFQVAFTWDDTKLSLAGFVPSPDYAWFSTNFVEQGVGEDAYLAVAQLPPYPPNELFTSTPAGRLVATLQFTAIDTVTNSAISIVAQVGSSSTQVRDAPIGGATVTGTFASTVTVTIECSLDAHCDDGDDCTADTCDVPSATCGHTFEPEFTACGDGTATTCNLADSCDGAGSCLSNFRGGGFPCGTATDTDCDNPDTCDGAGACLTNLEASGFACGEPGDTDCDNPDTCDGSGTCLDNFEPGTTTCGDPGDTECDNPDMCDGAGACSANLEPPGTGCGDGTDNFCTDPDTCDGSGTCLANDFNCPGQVCFEGTVGPECVDCLFGDDSRCNDFNPCTSDVCLFGNFCINSDLNGEPCPDADFCNGEETCQGGACLSPGNPCDDQNLCTDDFCNEPTDDCTFIPDDTNDPDDGLFCNGTDICQGGVVVPGDPPDCDDQIICTLDSCDTGVDACIHPNDPEQICDDADACTFDDVCVGGQCQGEDPPGGNGSVDLVWEPATMSVLLSDAILVELRAVSVDAIDDGVFSMRVVLQWDPTVVDLVRAVPSGAMTCGGAGGTPCTDNAACAGNPDGTICLTQWLSEWFPSESPLNDTWTDGDAEWNALAQLGIAVSVPPSPGLLVTSFEFAPVGLGNGSGVCAVPCIDGQTSAVGGGQAGPLSGNLGCATVNVVECITPADCDDGLACTGVEACVANVCVTPPDPCDDGEVCTDDSCQEGGGVPNCTNTANDLIDPDDGFFCNGVDTCSGGVVVVGNPPDCDDLDVCTDDSCSEIIRDCEYFNNTAQCDDGFPCTNSDVCASGVCAGAPTPDCVPCNIDPCDDGIDCTQDNCVSDICSFEPQDALCTDDNVVCNGVEYCDPQVGDPITGCAHSGEPCPGCVEEIGCGCETPLLAAVGSRYLALTPLPAGGAVPVGIVISACGGTMTKYVGAIAGETTAVPFDIDPSPCCLGIDGTLATLVDDPLDALFLAPGSTDGTEGGTVGWGGIVYIMANDVDPATLYEARLDCGEPPAAPALSAAVSATTWNFGDTDNDGVAGFLDVLRQVFGFKDRYVENGVTKPELDIHDCLPDQLVGFLDMLWVVDAFKDRPYSDVCSEVCGP